MFHPKPLKKTVYTVPAGMFVIIFGNDRKNAFRDKIQKACGGAILTLNYL